MMQILQRSVGHCSGLTDRLYGANPAGEKKSAFATYKVKAAASAHPLQMEAY